MSSIRACPAVSIFVLPFALFRTQQLVGHDQLRAFNILKWYFCRSAFDRNPNHAVRQTFELSPKAPAPVDRVLRFDPRLKAGKARKITLPDKRPVESRRRHLQGISSRNRILDIKKRRYRP